jgi:hypothetical protein
MSLISCRTRPPSTGDARLPSSTRPPRQPNQPRHLSPPPLRPPNPSTSHSTPTRTRTPHRLRPPPRLRIPRPARTTHSPSRDRTRRCTVSPRVRRHRSSPLPSIPPRQWPASSIHLPPHLHLTCTHTLPGVPRHRVRGPPLLQCPIWGQPARPTTTNLLLKSNRLCPAQV